MFTYLNLAVFCQLFTGNTSLVSDAVLARLPTVYLWPPSSVNKCRPIYPRLGYCDTSFWDILYPRPFREYPTVEDSLMVDCRLLGVYVTVSSETTADPEKTPKFLLGCWQFLFSGEKFISTSVPWLRLSLKFTTWLSKAEFSATMSYLCQTLSWLLELAGAVGCKCYSASSLAVFVDHIQNCVVQWQKTRSADILTGGFQKFWLPQF